MYYCENIQKSIDFIERHLKEEFDLNTAVKQSGYSVTHFYRIFQAFAGMSPKDYIRNRRLSEAAIELWSTNKRLIDLALEYGFNSQEAFTRAFDRLYHISPGRCRRTKNKIVLFEKVNVYHKTAVLKENYIEPRIILDREFHIAGLKKSVRPGDKLIKHMWEEFGFRKQELKQSAINGCLLGICEYKPEITDEDEFDYIACIEVKELNSIPDGMISKSIPGSKYAVFTHKGGLSGLKSAYNAIYASWLPGSGYELAELDTIEAYYPEAGSNDRLDIYIPIK